MNKFLLAIVALLVTAFAAASQMTSAQESGGINTATFNAGNEVVRPDGYRKWVFVGAPLTPNALNDGNAAFPEFHNVYVEPSAFEHWSKTGEWPDGAQIVKELVLIYQHDNDAVGASLEVSGRGYQQGEFAGLELAVKDAKRFPDMPGGWAYFTFGHHAPPYAKTVKASPAASCNACHAAAAADDFVFTQFYPVLRAAKP